MGKGRKERRLYVSDVACFHLYRYLRWRMAKEGLTMEELAQKPLFVSAKKPYSRMTVAGVQYLVKTLGKKAGVGNVHPHRFRRTFATDLLNRGMRIEEVMVLMGHTKIETTLIYCNIKQDNVRESYRKYAAQIGEKSTFLGRQKWRLFCCTQKQEIGEGRGISDGRWQKQSKFFAIKLLFNNR